MLLLLAPDVADTVRYDAVLLCDFVDVEQVDFTLTVRNIWWCFLFVLFTEAESRFNDFAPVQRHKIKWLEMRRAKEIMEVLCLQLRQTRSRVMKRSLSMILLANRK